MFPPLLSQSLCGANLNSLCLCLPSPVRSFCRYLPFKMCSIISLTSDELLLISQPSVGIISAGQNNEPTLRGTICQPSVFNPLCCRHLWRPPTLDWGAPVTPAPCPRPPSWGQPPPPPARPRQPRWDKHRSWPRLTRTATASVTSRTRCPNIYPKIRLVTTPRPQCPRPPPAPSWGSFTRGGQLSRLVTRRAFAEATPASAPPSLCLWSPASISTLSIPRTQPPASILPSLCRVPVSTASTTEASPGTRAHRNSGDILKCFKWKLCLVAVTLTQTISWVFDGSSYQLGYLLASDFRPNFLFYLWYCFAVIFLLCFTPYWKLKRNWKERYNFARGNGRKIFYIATNFRASISLKLTQGLMFSSLKYFC